MTAKCFRSSVTICDIDFPDKWKQFSTRLGRLDSDVGQFMGNPFGPRSSTFGIRIATDGVTD